MKLKQVISRLESAATSTSTSSKDLIKAMKSALTYGIFMDDAGKKYKGATEADIKYQLSGTQFARVQLNIPLQLLLRKEGLNVVTLTGKREGRGKTINFWTVKKTS